MDTKDDCKVGRFSWLANPAIIFGAFIYTIIIVVWGIRQEGRINLIEKITTDNTARINELDRQGTRQIPALELEIRTLTDAINRHINQGK